MYKCNSHSPYAQCRLMGREEKCSSYLQWVLCSPPLFLNNIRHFRILFCVRLEGELIIILLLLPLSVMPCCTWQWYIIYSVFSIYTQKVMIFILFIEVEKDQNIKTVSWKYSKIDFYFPVFCRTGVKLGQSSSICFRHEGRGGGWSHQLSSGFLRFLHDCCNFF